MTMDPLNPTPIFINPQSVAELLVLEGVMMLEMVMFDVLKQSTLWKIMVRARTTIYNFVVRKMRLWYDPHQELLSIDYWLLKKL